MLQRYGLILERIWKSLNDAKKKRKRHLHRWSLTTKQTIGRIGSSACDFEILRSICHSERSEESTFLMY